MPNGIPLRNYAIRTAAMLLCLASTVVASAEVRFSPQQMQEDLNAITAAIDRTHPDLRHSTDEAELKRLIDSVRRRLDRNMTRDEAWRQLATLNPAFADGHLFVGFAEWRAETASHLRQGGVLFPYEVYVNPMGQPYIRAKLGGGDTDLVGARLDRIDGRDARTVCATLLARVHGDTPTFRAELLSRRWWLYYWKMYGDKAVHELVVTRTKTTSVRVPGSHDTPLILRDESSFERQFQFEVLAHKSALLTVSAFDWPDKQRFLEFTRNAFTRVRDMGVRTLVIDIRANGGGDDVMWIEGILPYIATRPYRWASSFKERILEKYRDEGETTGAVVTGTLEQWIQPEPDNPLRFSGKVYVLVGRATYSSAILFSNVVQDFGFGTLAGTGDSARSAQSGGIQKIELPHTGLVIWSPRFVLTRPSGASTPALVTPDIALREDPYQPRAAVDALLLNHSAIE